MKKCELALIFRISVKENNKEKVASALLNCSWFLLWSCKTDQEITIPQENVWSVRTTIPQSLQPLHVIISAVKQLCVICDH